MPVMCRTCKLLTREQHLTRVRYRGSHRVQRQWQWQWHGYSVEWIEQHTLGPVLATELVMIVVVVATDVVVVAVAVVAVAVVAVAVVAVAVMAIVVMVSLVVVVNFWWSWCLWW